MESVYLSPSLPRLLFGVAWSTNFVGSESGQMQSVRKEGGGRVEPESRGEGQQGKVQISKLG
jgi:hypothetical protein